jgi:MYND finger/Domain of unknown function (DUF4470)
MADFFFFFFFFSILTGPKSLDAQTTTHKNRNQKAKILPYAISISDQIMSSGSFDKTCANCSSAGSTSRCSRCRRVYYCSRDCQRRHWKHHKKTCNDKSTHRVPSPTPAPPTSSSSSSSSSSSVPSSEHNNIIDMIRAVAADSEDEIKREAAQSASSLMEVYLEDLPPVRAERIRHMFNASSQLNDVTTDPMSDESMMMMMQMMQNIPPGADKEQLQADVDGYFEFMISSFASLVSGTDPRLADAVRMNSKHAERSAAADSLHFVKLGKVDPDAVVEFVQRPHFNQTLVDYCTANSPALDLGIDPSLNRPFCILQAGCSDLNTFFKTLAGAASSASSLSPVQYALLDANPIVIVRHMLMLYIFDDIVHTWVSATTATTATTTTPTAAVADVNADSDTTANGPTTESLIELLFQMWYSVALSEQHFHQLKVYLERMLFSTHELLYIDVIPVDTLVMSGVTEILEYSYERWYGDGRNDDVCCRTQWAPPIWSSAH